MNKRTFTEEEKALIMQDYRNPDYKVIAIREKWKLASYQLTAIIEEMGGEFRQPNSHHPKSTSKAKSKIKICPNCRKKIELAGARFCPFCAADIAAKRNC